MQSRFSATDAEPLFSVQLADFVLQPFVKIGALAAEGFVPIQAVAGVFGVSGNHSGNERFKRCRAVPHPAVFAVFAAGFGVEHVQQGFDFGLQGKPSAVVFVRIKYFFQPQFDVFQPLKTRVVPKQAQGSELGFTFRNALRIIVVELPDEFVQGAVALGFGQPEQDVADLLGSVPLREAEFGHDVFGGGSFR